MRDELILIRQMVEALHLPDVEIKNQQDAEKFIEEHWQEYLELIDSTDIYIKGKHGQIY